MSKDEEWDLTVSPARYLLRTHHGTRVDLARRLVTADLNKEHRPYDYSYHLARLQRPANRSS